MIMKLHGVRNCLSFLDRPVRTETEEGQGYYCTVAVEPNHPRRQDLFDALVELAAGYHGWEAARGIVTEILETEYLGYPGIDGGILYLNAVTPDSTPPAIQDGEKIKQHCYVDVEVRLEYVYYAEGTGDFVFTLLSVAFNGDDEPKNPTEAQS